ncbi:helix-turn-helix domain-containing protein [Microvirga terricola]|uniref:Helix-turn-helix domain-containing protein n=1 Tax=Microvirga terricola TaxID=2719797 RepID=A0ABX0V9Z2_9HYPH|nr:helix-turn-helix domain-containing protein [Microvirga terricola]NIX76477.1 helix-turn-helix domain-containing protein [Microvirga terricola]
MSKAHFPAKVPSSADRRIGQRIRLRRLDLGMSQERLAETLGLTFQQVQKYENGKNRVSAGRLQEIARALGVSVTFFYDDEDLPPIGQGTPYSVSLLRAFGAIAHPDLRRQALAVVQAIAGVKA